MQQERENTILQENPWIEELYRRILRHHPKNRKRPAGLSDEEALNVVKKYKEECDFELPHEYLTFLKLINGYKDSSIEVYGNGPEYCMDGKKILDLEFGVYNSAGDPDDDGMTGGSYRYDLVKGEYFLYDYNYEEVEKTYKSFTEMLFDIFGVI